MRANKISRMLHGLSQGSFTLLEVVITIGVIAILGVVSFKISSIAVEVSLKSAERLLIDELRLAREWSLGGSGTCYGISFDPSYSDRFRRIKKSGAAIAELEEIPLPVGVKLSPYNSTSMTNFSGDRVYFNSRGSPSMAGSIVISARRKVARIALVPDTGRVESQRKGW
ncbi:MAG: type II secretion system protein [bacterium]|nr:type II secretion system protein [bacterium]MDD3806067.1 type II secretion system protein [bacterium]MDD4152492.1 type II secretion system protein [bacterium]MDD4559104.1 type II secretion system protein [bacterium]